MSAVTLLEWNSGSLLQAVEGFRGDVAARPHISQSGSEPPRLRSLFLDPEKPVFIVTDKVLERPSSHYGEHVVVGGALGQEAKQGSVSRLAGFEVAVHD